MPRMLVCMAAVLLLVHGCVADAGGDASRGYTVASRNENMTFCHLQGSLPSDSKKPKGLQTYVTLHVFLRVVSDPAARKVYVKGTMLMEDSGSFDQSSKDTDIRSSAAFDKAKKGALLR
ncbi:MAG: hypothetical protein WDW36_004926 [Sanguina aurantia]